MRSVTRRVLFGAFMAALCLPVAAQKPERTDLFQFGQLLVPGN